MKFTISFAVVAIFVAIANSAEDGKYRPTEASTTIRTIQTYPTYPTTRVTPHRPQQCQWPYDRCDHRDHHDYDHRYDRYDPRYPSYPGYQPRYDPSRYDPQARRYDPRIPSVPVIPTVVPRGYGYDRPIRLDEKIDAKGYTYIYETARGIYAEEVGTYDIIGLGKPTGVRIQGFVQIKDGGLETFRMDYQASSKDPEVARRSPIVRDQERIPPTMARALELLISHA